MARKKQEDQSAQENAQNAEPAPIDAAYEEVRSKNPVIEVGGKSLVVRLDRTEIDAQYDQASKRPRNLVRIQTAVQTMVRLNKDDAASMYYSLPRGGKTIEGPSVRFAEILYQVWGNCHVDSKIVDINRNDKYVLAESTFVDRETGASRKKTVRRPIRDKYGNVYNEATIDATCGAAMAIAERNAILASIPRIVWRAAYDDARKVAAGDLKDLAKTRRDMIQAFGKLDVKPDMLLRQIGVTSEQEITLAHLTTLRGMYATIANNESTKEEVFAQALENKEDKNAPKKATKLDEIKSSKDEKPAPTKDQIRSEGYKAYYKGLSIEATPEKYSEEEAKIWIDGWNEACNEDDISENSGTEE